MSEDCLKVTAYFGEHDRHEGRFLSETLLDLYERHSFRTSVLLRGTEGFGLQQRLQTQRLLSLSEDLPLVSIGVDVRERVEPVLDELRERVSEGLLTIERARLSTGRIDDVGLPTDAGDATKLTVYCGRGERAQGRSAALAVVDLLQRHGVAGATVLLGVDGTMYGLRRRARFFSRNASVPLMIISVGSGAAIAHAVPELGSLLDRPLLTLERVRLLKRDGDRLDDLTRLPEQDASGMQIWQKLMIYASEQARFEGHPLYVQLIRRLREEGASGATALRGVWGYHGDHPPHGDRLLSLRRHVPVVTVVVDRPEAIRRVWPVVDAATAESGLVTSELVPAYRAAASGVEHGGLRLARHRSSGGSSS